MARLIAFILFVFVCGCAISGRIVYDNILTSGYPPIKIKVDDEFFYLGNPSTGESGKTLDNFDLRGGRDAYLFAIPAKGKAERFLAIEFKWTQGYFGGKLYEGVKAIRKEEVIFNGKKYQSCTMDFVPGQGSYLTKFTASRGIIFKPGFLKAYGRIWGANGSTLINILYYEPLLGNTIDEFENRADNSFKIIP